MKSFRTNHPGPDRADVIPGYILSRPGHDQRVEAEKEIILRFVAGVAALATNLPAPLAREGLLIAHDAIKYCELREGTPANDVWMKTLEMAPFLAWLCLKVKHPQTTLAQTCELFTKHNGDGIALATWQLWGLISPDDQATVHIDDARPEHAAA